jgi:hypothetical protein
VTLVAVIGKLCIDHVVWIGSHRLHAQRADRLAREERAGGHARHGERPGLVAGGDEVPVLVPTFLAGGVDGDHAQPV